MAQQSGAVASQASAPAIPDRRSQGLSGIEERKHLRQTPGFWRRAWRRFHRNKVAMVGLGILVLVVVFVLGAGLISSWTGYSYSKASLDVHESLLDPGTGGHILGTDKLGRDTLVRLAYGGRVSLRVAGLAATLTLAIGALVGAVSGYFGGFIDGILMRFVDVLLCLPGISILILVSALYHPGPNELAVLIAVISWTGIARLVRAEVLSLRSRDFIEATRVIGASNARIIFRHILPNVVPIMVVWVSLAIPGLILLEASLSFLGLGVKIPTPSWGNMLQEAAPYFTKSWWVVFIPGFAIYITVLAINLVGNGLRDALDPRLNE
jgi:peptide/nickel transport system permease protein